MAVVILLVFTGIGFRLTVLHLRPASWVLEPIEKGRMYEWKPVGNRGRIVDRNNQILAMDLAAYHVYADPKYIAEHGDADLVAKHLSHEFKLSEDHVRERLADTSRQYVRLKKYVPGHRLKQFKRRAYGVNYTPKELFNGSETNIYLRGVGLEDAPIRNYPKGPLMAHVVGFA
ncbi:MAG TPA: hypothetical protein VIR63_06025, partial [Pontiella sp.]